MASALKPNKKCILFNASFKGTGNETNPNDTLNTSDEKSPIGKRKVSLILKSIPSFFVVHARNFFFK